MCVLLRCFTRDACSFLKFKIPWSKTFNIACRPHTRSVPWFLGAKAWQKLLIKRLHVEKMRTTTLQCIYESTVYAKKNCPNSTHTHFCMLVFKGHPGNVIALTNGPATDKHYVNPASSLRNARNGKIAFSELFLLQLSITKKVYI